MSQTTYIETELGLLPSDWKVVTIGEVGYVITGTTPPTSDVRNYGREYMFVSPADLGHSKYVKRTEKYLSTKGFNLARRLPPDSILYTCIGSTIGKMGVATQELATNQQINAVIPFSGYDADYLYYAINFRRNLIIGDVSIQAVPLINKNDFSSKHISVPTDISEQERIAATLTSIDSLIDNLNRTIAKKQNIRQGAMEQLLSGQLRLPGFKKKWVESELDSIIKIKKGAQLNSSELLESGPYPMINGGQEPSGYTTTYNTESNTITISEGGNSCGFVNYIRHKFWSGGHCYNVSIRYENQLDKEFLFHLLKAHEKEIMSLRVGSGLPNIQSKSLLEMRVMYPTDIKEQQAIADTLTAMDDEIAMLQLERDKYANIRAGMMDELLSGKKRLIKI